jgi:hypothetical protein
MANNILSSLYSQAVFSIVDSNGNAVATGIKIRKVSIKYEAHAMKHTMEDGSTKIDSKIIMAPVINVEFFCPTLSDQDSVTAIMVDRSQTYTVTTKGLIFKPMFLMTEKIDQTPDVLSAAPLQITFKQLLVQARPAIIFKQAADSTLIDKGLAALTSAKQQVTDLATTVSTQAGTALSAIQRLI